MTAREKLLSLQGRISRLTFWSFNVFVFFLVILVQVASAYLPSSITLSHPLFLLIFKIEFAIILTYTSICVNVKRLHDLNFSGWFILIPFVSFFSAFFKGTNGPNRYGANPLEGQPALTDFRLSRYFIKSYPLESILFILILLLRYLYTTLFIYGFVHKIMRGWMWSDILTQHFTKRLHELLATTASPGSLEASIAMWQASYLQHFALPLVMPIAWIVTIGELVIGVALLFGVTTRINAAFGLFMLLNFAAGGYYNETIPPLVTISILLIALPTGHWLGLDRTLNRKYPDSPWFK